MMDDTSKIEKISRMLELGGTMLSEHCETCGSPLFRYRGEILCPVCRDQNKAGDSGAAVKATQ